MNLLAYEILHLERVLMEQATRRGWSQRRFHERVLRVASQVLCQATDFRGESKGDGVDLVVEEAGAGGLGAGIGDSGGIGPVEGTEAVGFSHRKVDLSAGDVPPDRWRVYDGFNHPVIEPIPSNRQRFKRNWAATARKRRVGSLYQHVP